MQELSRPVWQDQPPTRNAAVETALASLIDHHGYSLFTQAGRLRQLLTDAAPDASRHIAVIVVALSAEIPQRLSVAKSDAALAGALREWVQSLQRHASLDAAWATWAVAVWAHAIGLPTIALGIVMDADPFPTSAGTRAPTRDASAASTPATSGVVAPQTVEAAFANRRVEPGFGRPATTENPANAASAILIDPLFPEQRPRTPAPQPGAETRPASPSTRATPAPTFESSASDATVGPVATASPPRRDARMFGQVAGGLVLVAIGVAIGFALGSASGPGAPAVSTTGAPTAAMQTSPSSPVPDPPKPKGTDPVEPRRAAPSPDESDVAPVASPSLTASSAEPTDAAGARGDPDRVSNTVVEATPRSTIPLKACTAATCGTVVSARELGRSGSAHAYDILVRMDNRDTRSFAARDRLQAGSRVRMSGGHFIPMDSRRR